MEWQKGRCVGLAGFFGKRRMRKTEDCIWAMPRRNFPRPELVEGRTIALGRSVPQLDRRLLARLLVAALVGTAVPAAAAPKVVASIKPIHSLIAGVMAGVGEPQLIVSGGASPHLYTLKPSDAERLEHADLVFWVGPIFEGFLVKPIAVLAGKAVIVELDRAPGVTLLPARQGGAWDADADRPAASALEQDGHLWLDPANAKAIVRVAVARLSTLDPAQAAAYGANGAALERRLDVLDASLRQRLGAVAGLRFVVFHDAYQYFERRYGLAAIGSITVSPEHRPGARRLREIRGKIAGLGVRCVFSEPQFEPRLVETVIAGTGARADMLDPEGAALVPGPDLYGALLTGLADRLESCLAAP
jgi:zinc transport system substrate-binding protein